MKTIDPKNPPSSITVALTDAGWSWNEDWTWTDPATQKTHPIKVAVRLAHVSLK